MSREPPKRSASEVPPLSDLPQHVTRRPLGPEPSVGGEDVARNRTCAFSAASTRCLGPAGTGARAGVPALRSEGRPAAGAGAFRKGRGRAHAARLALEGRGRSASSTSPTWPASARPSSRSRAGSERAATAWRSSRARPLTVGRTGSSRLAHRRPPSRSRMTVSSLGTARASRTSVTAWAIALGRAG